MIFYFNKRRHVIKAVSDIPILSSPVHDFTHFARLKPKGLHIKTTIDISVAYEVLLLRIHLLPSECGTPSLSKKYLRPSGVNFSASFMGSTTFPIDLDIFLSSINQWQWQSSWRGGERPTAIKKAGQYTA